MKPRHGAFPFRYALPTLQLLACFIILWPYRGMLLFEIRHDSILGDGPPNMQRQPEPHSGFPWQELRLRIPWALNAPAEFIELPYDICCNDNENWNPLNFDIDLWRSMTLPFVGLPLWWIMGRGLEAISAGRQQVLFPSLTWLEMIVAVFLCLIGMFLLTAPFWGRPTGELGDGILSFGSGALWTILGAIFINARVFQWRIRKRLRTAPSV